MEHYLYNKLLTESKSTLSVGEVCSTIRSLSKNSREIIYSFIIHAKYLELTSNGMSNDIAISKMYPVRTSRSLIMNLPYGGKTAGNGMGGNFEFNLLPLDCQKVICEYVSQIAE